jgi:hypothetical protein
MMYFDPAGRGHAIRFSAFTDFRRVSFIAKRRQKATNEHTQ